MMRIAILSDTHDVMRPEILEGIKGCDAILHAGDICSEEVMDQLRALAPIYAVRGNNDFGWARSLSRTLSFQFEQLRFFMVHNSRDVPFDLKLTDVIIFGHTHRYYEDVEDGILWLNPGSAGWARYKNELSYVIMTIEEKKYSIEKHVIKDERGGRFFW